MFSGVGAFGLVRRSVVRCARQYNSLLARPLGRDSTIQHITFKSTELLKILQNTQGAIIKLEDQDVEDMRVMMERLPKNEPALYDKLAENIIKTKFYEMSDNLMIILLDLLKTKNSDRSLLFEMVKHLMITKQGELSADVRSRLYDAWAIHSSDIQREELLKSQDEVESALAFNITTQTFLLQGNLTEAYNAAIIAFDQGLLLDRYIIEILSFHLLHHKQVSEVHELITCMHKNTEQPYYKRYLPLSNQQLGRTISLSVGKFQYDIAKDLINKFCIYQRLHYIDQGTLVKFLLLTVTHSDFKQFRKALRLLQDTDKEFFTTANRRMLTILYLEAKYHQNGADETVDSSSIAQDFKNDIRSLKAFDNIKVSDIPYCVETLSPYYTSANIGTLLDDIAFVLDSGRKVTKLFVNTIIAALAGQGKPELIFALISGINEKFPTKNLIDKDAMIYVVRSYYMSDKNINEQSAKFLISLVSKGQTTDSKTYRLIIKLLKTHYKDDPKILEPVINAYHSSLA